MAYTVKEIIDKALVRGKDSSFSRSLLLDYIDATQSEVLGVKRYAFMETSYDETLPINEYKLTLNDEVQVIDYIGLTNGTTTNVPKYLAHRDFFRDITPTDSTGEPSYFTLHGREIVFSCKADKIYTLSMNYLCRPTEITLETQEPDMPWEYKEILILGALAGMEEYRDNFDKAALYRQRIEDLAGDMSGRHRLRQLINAPKQRNSGFRREAN